MAKTPDKKTTKTTTKVVKPDSVTISRKAKSPGVKPKKAVDAKKVSPHKLVLRNAALTGQRALDYAKKGKDSITKYKREAASGKHAPLVPVAGKQVAVGGVPHFEIGAAPPALSKLAPKRQAAVRKHTASVVAHSRAVRKLSLAVAKAERAGKAAKDFVRKTTPEMKRALQNPKSTKTAIGAELLAIVSEYGDEVLGMLAPEEMEAIGAVVGLEGEDYFVGGEDDLPPEEPIDPNLAKEPGAGGLDPETGIVTDMSGNVIYDPAKDPDVVPLPERGGKLSASDAQAIWEHVPEDGILCPYAAGDQEVGSWSLMYDKPWINEKQGIGFIWHANPGENMKWWAIGLGKERDNVLAWATATFAPMGALWAADFAKHPVSPGHGVDSGLGNDAMKANEASIAVRCGPIVGNPNGRLAGVQLATVDKAYFWQGRNAPAWACAEVDAKLAQANKKTIDANTAAALVVVAEQEKAWREIQEKQARQAAEEALKQQAAEAEAKALQTKSEAEKAAAEARQATERADADTAYQKQQDAAEAAQRALDADYQRLQMEAMKQQTAIDAAAQRAMIDEATAWNAWAKAHPEQAYAADQAASLPEPAYEPDFGPEQPAYEDIPDAEYVEDDGQMAAFDPRSDAYDEVVGGAYGGWDHYEIGEEMV